MCIERERERCVLGGTACLRLLVYVNTASVVFYGTTRLIRLIEFAAFFAAFEEHIP